MVCFDFTFVRYIDCITRIKTNSHRINFSYSTQKYQIAFYLNSFFCLFYFCLSHSVSVTNCKSPVSIFFVFLLFSFLTFQFAELFCIWYSNKNKARMSMSMYSIATMRLYMCVFHIRLILPPML